MIAYFSSLAGVDVDQLEEDGGRCGRWRGAVVSHHKAYFLGLIWPHRNKLAAIGARRQAHEINQCRGQSINTDDEITILQLLIHDANSIAIT